MEWDVAPGAALKGSDHCPAMKGIETGRLIGGRAQLREKRPLPRNEGD